METIKQSDINKSLSSRISEEDISSSTGFCTKAYARNSMTYDLMSKKRCTDCPEHDNCMFSMPEGNMNSEIMFVGAMPSKIDGLTHTTLYDDAGRFLTVILDKLGKSRDNVYMTNVTKCHTDEDVDFLPLICMNIFLLREIKIIQPKVIVTLGLESANILRKYFLGYKPEEDISVLRAKPTGVEFQGSRFHICHTHSPEFVIGKSGGLYTKYKKDIWNDISNAIKLTKESLS